MRKRIAQLFWIVVLAVLGFGILHSLPFRAQIHRELVANVYQDGIVTGTTAVLIDGEKTNYLFHDDVYNGVFAIAVAEETGQDGVAACIMWEQPRSRRNVQDMRYYTRDHREMDARLIWYDMIINLEMTQFALTLEDGTVLATTDEVYRIYTEHITHDLDTGITTIIGRVPSF